MQRLTYVLFINLAHYYGKRPVPAVCVVNSRFRLCTSPVPRPTIVAFDLGTRLHVHMRTKLENGVLRNGQPTQSVVNGFSDQGEFEAVKTLSGWTGRTIPSGQRILMANLDMSKTQGEYLSHFRVIVV